MKQAVLKLIGFAMILQLALCSSAPTGSNAPVDPAVKACKSNCAVIYNQCVQKAGKIESKKADCGIKVNNCFLKCDGKSPADYREPKQKKSTHSEL